jgi:hypothetical protein
LTPRLVDAVPERCGGGEADDRPVGGGADFALPCLGSTRCG